MEELLVILALALVIGVPAACLAWLIAVHRRIRRLDDELRAVRDRLDQHAARGQAWQAWQAGQAGAAAPDAPTGEPPPGAPPAAGAQGGSATSATGVEPGARVEPGAATAGGRRPAPGARAPVAPRPAGGQLAPGAAPAAPGRALTLEAFVGGRVLLVAGVVAVLFALAFFLKVAFERGWIGPLPRVVMGGLAGLALLAGGDRLRARGLAVFGAGLMGAGLGALYLSIYFAGARYELLPRGVAFALVAAVTAGGALLAVRRDAPLLAWLGLLGGFLAPALLGRDVDALGPLTAWLALLHAGVLVVLLRRAWPALVLGALVASLLYYAGWYDRWYTPARLDAASWSLATLVALVVATCIAPALLARRALATVTIIALALVGLAGVSAGHELLYPGHRVRLGAGVLALAAVQLGAARVLAARGQRRDGAALDALGLAALAAAVPVLLGGRLVTPAWSALGTAAVFIATRRRHPVLAAGGVLVIVLAILEALGNRPPHYDEPFVPFFNAAFLSLASPCVALVIAGRLLRGGDALRGAGSFVTLGLWAFTPLLAAEAFHVFHVDVARHGAAARPLGLASATVALAAYTLAVALVTRTAGRLGDRIAVPAWSVPLLAALGFGVALVAMPRDAPFLVALNPLFCAGGFLVAASFFVAAGSTPQLGAAVRLAAVAYSLLLITAEIDAWGRLPGLFGGVEGETRRWRAQVLISVAWAVYAAVLVAAGLGRRRAELRWAGLVLFLLAVVKVFVLDLAQLDVAYRIGSFLALGVLLVAASYLYHRRQDGGS